VQRHPLANLTVVIIITQVVAVVELVMKVQAQLVDPLEDLAVVVKVVFIKQALIQQLELLTLVAAVVVNLLVRNQRQAAVQELLS
jgi:hypothetical protein